MSAAAPKAEVKSGYDTGSASCPTSDSERNNERQLPGSRAAMLAARRFSPDYFARLNTSSNVTPAGVRGFVIFNSSSVIDVTIRR